MEAVLHPDIPYSRLPLMIRCARIAILSQWQAQAGLSQSCIDASTCIAPLGSDVGRLPHLVPRMTPMRLGPRLLAALQEYDRELTDPTLLSTDHGAGCGSRLQPMIYGNMSLYSPVPNAKASDALAALCACRSTTHVDRMRLATVDERRASIYYADAPMILADVHRIGMSQQALENGDLRSALQESA